MGPEYTSGISRVDAIVEEVDERRKRLNQLAEAKRLRVEQFKQLYSCEKDAKQVRHERLLSDDYVIMFLCSHDIR